MILQILSLIKKINTHCTIIFKFTSTMNNINLLINHLIYHISLPNKIQIYKFNTSIKNVTIKIEHQKVNTKTTIIIA